MIPQLAAGVWVEQERKGGSLRAVCRDDGVQPSQEQRDKLWEPHIAGQEEREVGVASACAWVGERSVGIGEWIHSVGARGCMVVCRRARCDVEPAVALIVIGVNASASLV